MPAGDVLYASRSPKRRSAPALCLLVCLGLAATVESAEASERAVLTNLGGARVFSRPPLETAADLQRVFREQRLDLLEVLEQAAWEGDPEDLFRAVDEGRFTERAFEVGGELQWMVYRDPEGVGLHRDAVWAGDEPFEAFEILPVSNGFRWTFVVPKACANLALVSRLAVEELDVSMAAGNLRLRTADGREVVVRGGERSTLYVPRGAARSRRNVEPGVDSSLAVSEGSVEFRDPGHPVAVTVETDYLVTAVVSPSGRLGLETPESNPGELPIRIGDAVGTLSEGARLKAGWVEELAAEPLDVRIVFGEPSVAPRSGIHDAWILGPGAAIEVEIEDPGGNAARWTPLVDGQPVSPDALHGPWPAGEHTVAVRTVDSAGDSRDTAPVAFVYDPDPPELSWGVEGVGPLGRLSESEDPASPSPGLRGNRLLEVGRHAWELDSDHTQVVARPQIRRPRHYAAVEEPLGPESGFWVLAEDALCPDSGRVAYELVEDAGGEPVLWVEAVDCVGNARQGRWSLARVKP